jgi:thiol-disulfide isomerase/thioredoxin
MKHPFIIGTILVLAALGIGVFFVSKNTTQSPTTMNENAMMEKTDMMEQDTDIMDTSAMMMDSRYVAYSPEVFDASADQRRVLFFYASWCPTCRPADADFQEQANSIPSDVKLIRVNYNDPETDQKEKDLADTYGVTYQHTFVQIDEQGNEITIWNGGQMDELLTNIQ